MTPQDWQQFLNALNIYGYVSLFFGYIIATVINPILMDIYYFFRYQLALYNRKRKQFKNLQRQFTLD